MKAEESDCPCCWPKSQILQPIETYQEADVSSKKRQKLSVKQPQDKVRHTSNTLETARKQIAALKNANAGLLERVQHLEAEDNDLRVTIEQTESGKRLAEDRLADRSERFSLSRRKNKESYCSDQKR